MISIIIPVYNQADKISKTLKSIEGQSFRDYEVIIVNDGSTDTSEEKVAEFFKNNQSLQDHYFFNQTNQGAPAARNRGLKEAKGNYLLFCDADAVLVPDALEVMLTNLEKHKDVSYVYSSFNWGKKLFKLDEFNAERLKKMPYIHSLSLIRRDDFPIKGWDETLKKFQDWDLWLTMLKNNKIGLWIPRVLFKIETGGTISAWLPSFAYDLFPFLPAVKKYKRAMAIIKQKHNLENI